MKKVLAMDWERMIPGHPGPGGRLGTKKDVEDQLKLLQAASAEMKKLAQDGKCWDAAEKDFKLPEYAEWPGYANSLQFIARRYCGGTANMSDGQQRTIWYLIEDGMGLAGMGDNVEFCISGLDRWLVYNGSCRVLR